MIPAKVRVTKGRKVATIPPGKLKKTIEEQKKLNEEYLEKWNSVLEAYVGKYVTIHKSPTSDERILVAHESVRDRNRYLRSISSTPSKDGKSKRRIYIHSMGYVILRSALKVHERIPEKEWAREDLLERTLWRISP